MQAIRYYLPWVAVALLAGIAVALLVVPAEALFVHVPRNYNEGWNALHALRLRSGGPLYPPLSGAVFINYPPLSFYLVAALHPLFGDDIFAGRAIALLAELTLAANIAIAARALRVSWPLAAAVGCIFLIFAGVLYEDAVGIDDPQWLGHALQSTGLVLLLRKDRIGWRTLILVAGLCLLGGLAKQSLLALPLAISAWLALEDRRALLRWVVVSGTLVLLALGAFIAIHGRGFIDQVLLSERGLWLDGLVFVGGGLAFWLAPYGLFAGCGLVLARKQPHARLIAIYCGVSLLIGVALLAVNGVGYSALFDFTIAATLGGALFFDWLAQRLAAHAIARPLSVLAPALPILLLGPTIFAPQAQLRADLARRAEWQDVIAQIARTDGDVACEMLSLCYWAGRPSEVDFFNFGQYAGLHPGFAGPLTGRIQARALALIQEDGPAGSRRLPADTNAAMARSYAAVRTSPTTLLVPAP